MKKYFLALTFLVLASNINAQTKKETIDWLNSKFGGNQSSIYESDVISFARFLKIKDDGTFIITQYETWHNDNGSISNYLTTMSGDFKNLSPNSFRTSKIENRGKHSLSSTNNTFLFLTCSPGSYIKQIDYKEGTKPSDGQVSMASASMTDVTIAIIPESADQSLIERSKKAFLHLIELCGGKKEAF